jgi:hypothetical protein
MARFVDVCMGITPSNVRSDGLAPCKCSIVKLGKMTRIAAGIYTNEEPPRQLVYGVAQEVLAALPAEGAVSGPQRFTAPAVVFDPEALKRVLDELCAAAGVEVRLDSQIIAACRDAANWLLTNSPRLAPRQLVARMAERTMRPAKPSVHTEKTAR